MESAEIERELEELETRVERLRGLYEQYFMGIEKTEPQIPRKDVDRRIWILRREQIRNTGLRFKFQMIVQRYNTFQQYWARVAREIENGTYRRDVMRAAARFGEKDALTVLGKKRADQYRTLIQNQKKAREAGRKAVAAALGEEAPVEEAATVAVPRPEPSGPGWGDITEVMDPGDAPAPASDRAGPESQSPKPAVAPAPLGGLRWSLGKPKAPAPAPSEPTAVEGAPPVAPRLGRVAELAAEMRAKRNEANATRASGLDLDFEGDMTLPGAPPGQPKRRRSSKSMKAVRPPVAAPSAAPSEPTAPNRAPIPSEARPPVAPAPPAGPLSPFARPGGLASPLAKPVPSTTSTSTLGKPPAPPPPAARPLAPPMDAKPLATPARVATPPLPTGGKPIIPGRVVPPTIHSGEAPWDEATQMSTRRKLAESGSRPEPRAIPAPKPSEPTMAEPAAKRPSAEELSDQRIRQIYSKYVETKRNANESTAGVTYERLAQSLRAQADKLRTSHPTKTVDYEVVTKDGKTMLKPILR